LVYPFHLNPFYYKLFEVILQLFLRILLLRRIKRFDQCLLIAETLFFYDREPFPTNMTLCS